MSDPPKRHTEWVKSARLSMSAKKKKEDDGRLMHLKL